MERLDRINQRRINSYFFLFFLVGIFSGYNPDLSLAEISVDSYCQLTIKSMEQQIPQTQELISIVHQYKDNPEMLDWQLEIKRAQFDRAREMLYSSYGTSAQEFVTYINRNGKAVYKYIDANQDIKAQIDDLAAQLNILMEEEDALGRDQEEPDELPLPAE
jgi:hypothetical protein